MPVYEFICQDCHQTFEITRPITEAGGTVACPKCGSKKIERTWSSVFAVTSKKS